ncbi:hypothetical protein KC340_g15381 [Hortaea werneckii]|nr:hypothetical protein KC342_g12110 [Hortaea werneckii]KAI7079985.1 hypothetical protein KC339_g13527 [Hortaea werneckii]KAI7227352.1 hypothetical protein KC365_g8944 [Hortaea werneckii]KAI7296507.1 hypothetical protein KC340_g15381 [Hortaea werneckii]KAI7382768.1 hypothetical protein KC328_g11613 [Hortaea werneckii]
MKLKSKPKQMIRQAIQAPASSTSAPSGHTNPTRTKKATRAAKQAKLGLMHSMAISLQDFGIRVNLVAPGRIKVAHESKEGDEKGLEWAQLNEEKDVQDHPSNRAGRPEDVADAVEYLVNAGFVTGQEITVDGGATRVVKKS